MIRRTKHPKRIVFWVLLKAVFKWIQNSSATTR
jgi:hypothetical protein